MQRTREWTEIDEGSLRYHLSQWENPKESTKGFERFVRPELKPGTTVVDLGCGAGAATAFLAEAYPRTVFFGIDLSPELIETAEQARLRKGIKNLRFTVGDWYDLESKAAVDGVVSLQSLSWLPEFEAPLREIFVKLRPRWVALTSLFYDGEISCRIEVTEHIRGDRRTFYNVYAIPAVQRFCEKERYRITSSKRFEIGVDLPKPENPDLMGTYTVRARRGEKTPAKRLQISGPLLMNWYALLVERVSSPEAE
jgi:SAM-dependent methyltransferase